METIYQLKPEERLLISAVKTSLQGQGLDSAQNKEVLLHTALLAVEQKLLPFTLDALYSNTFFSSNFKAKVREQIAGQVLRGEAFGLFYEQLIERGFHPVVVKGIVCRSLYPKPDYRISADDDLLILKSEWDFVIQFMLDSGFYCLSQDADFGNAYELGFRQHSGSLYIELHRSLFDPDSKAFKSYNTYFDASASFNVKAYDGRTYLSLSPSSSLLYLFLHAGKHFIAGGVGVRQLLDIGLWTNAYADSIDFTALLNVLRNENLLGFASAVYSILTFEFNFSLPEPISDLLDQDSYQLMLADILSSGIYGTNTLARQHSGTVTVNRVGKENASETGSIFKTLFPGYQSMAGKYPVLYKKAYLLPYFWMKRIGDYFFREKKSSGNSAAETIALAKERIQLLNYYHMIDD